MSHDHRTTKPKTAVVLGAGIVGVCVALNLQERGWHVILLDPAEPGEGASKGNAGVIAIDHVTPVGMPGIVWDVPRMLLARHAPLSIRWPYLPRLAPWLYRFVRASTPRRVSEISQALAGLLAEAYDCYLPLLDAAGARDLFRRRGWLMVYESEAAFARDANARAIRERHGVRIELLGVDEIGQLAPAVTPRARRGVLFPDCGQTVNPHRLVQTLAAAVRERDGEIVRDAARAFSFEDGRVNTVIGAAGSWAADAVVVAAGAWSKPLATQLGSPVPLDTERGYHVMFEAPGVDLSLPIASGDLQFAITPMEHGLRAAGTVELGGLEAPPTPARHASLVAVSQRLLPGLDTTRQSRWMGFRPSMPDSLPVLGRAPHCPNAFFAFGHGHIGITAGAITGRLVAQEVAGEATDLDLAPFKAGRFVA